jgi:hypothetical protein
VRDLLERFGRLPAWPVLLWAWTAIYAVGVLVGRDEVNGFAWLLCVLVAVAVAIYLWQRLGPGWEVPHGLAWLVLFAALKLPDLDPLVEFLVGAPLSVALAYLFIDRPAEG